VIWCSVLCYVGVKMGQDEGRHITIWVGGAALVFGGLYYFFVHRHMAGRKAESGKRKAG